VVLDLVAPLRNSLRELRSLRCTPVEAFIQQGESPCRGKPEPRSRRQLRRCEAGWGAAARRTGGPQDDELDSAGERWRARSVGAKPETHCKRWHGGQSDLRTVPSGWRWNARKGERDKQADLCAAGDGVQESEPS